MKYCCKEFKEEIEMELAITFNPDYKTFYIRYPYSTSCSHGSHLTIQHIKINNCPWCGKKLAINKETK